MKRNIRLGLMIVAGFAVMIVAGAAPGTNSVPPRIQGHGQVTQFPEAPAQPRDGSKIVVDLTAGSSPDQLNKAVAKLARYVNIYSQAGKEPARATIHVVLHGDATSVALNDAAYAAAYQTEGNPNLPLLRKLHSAGVRFVVCGQTLSSKGYRVQQTAEEVDVAVSALTALVNRQQDGYVSVPLSN